MPTRNLAIIALIALIVPTASAIGLATSGDALVLDLDVAQVSVTDEGAWINILGQKTLISSDATVATALPYLGVDPLAPQVSTPGIPGSSGGQQQAPDGHAESQESDAATPWTRPGYDGPPPRVLCAPSPSVGLLALGILPRACLELPVDLPFDIPVVDGPTEAPLTTASVPTSRGGVPDDAKEPASSNLPLVALAGVIIVTAAATGTPLFALILDRLRKFALLAALYSRLTPERILDNNVRDNLFEALKAKPGTAISDLAKATDIPRNTATHHLHMLEKQGLVTSTRQGRVRLYFPVGSGVQRRSADAFAALRHDTTSALAREIGREPGQDQGALGDRFGLKPSLTHWHVGRLVESGLVQQVRDGRRVRYYPGDAFHLVMNEGMRGPGV